MYHRIHMIKFRISKECTQAKCTRENDFNGKFEYTKNLIKECERNKKIWWEKNDTKRMERKKKHFMLPKTSDASSISMYQRKRIVFRHPLSEHIDNFNSHTFQHSSAFESIHIFTFTFESLKWFSNMMRSVQAVPWLMR